MVKREREYATSGFLLKISTTIWNRIVLFEGKRTCSAAIHTEPLIMKGYLEGKKNRTKELGLRNNQNVIAKVFVDHSRCSLVWRVFFGVSQSCELANFL